MESQGPPAQGAGADTHRVHRMKDWIVIILMALSLGGCTAFEVIAPDGTQLRGISLLTNKGLGRARIEGLGEIEGYSSDAAAAIRTAIEAATAGAVKGALHP